MKRKFSIFDFSKKDLPTRLLVIKDMKSGEVEVLELECPCEPNFAYDKTQSFLIFDMGEII